MIIRIDLGGLTYQWWWADNQYINDMVGLLRDFGWWAAIFQKINMEGWYWSQIYLSCNGGMMFCTCKIWAILFLIFTFKLYGYAFCLSILSYKVKSQKICIKILNFTLQNYLIVYNGLFKICNKVWPISLNGLKTCLTLKIKKIYQFSYITPPPLFVFNLSLTNLESDEWPLNWETMTKKYHFLYNRGYYNQSDGV